MNRRSFLQLGASVAIAHSTGLSLAQPNNYQALLNGQYTGLVQFKPISRPGTWLGEGTTETSFPLVNSPFRWQMRRGEYKGTYSHHDEDITGYWIFSSDRNICWQAPGYGRGILKYWNFDHKAKGNPEDYELFSVMPANPSQQTVIIRNAAYNIWLRDTNGSTDFDPAVFINLVGTNFTCDARQRNAVELQVLFG